MLEKNSDFTGLIRVFLGGGINVTVCKNVHLSNCIRGANGKENITVYEAAILNIRE